MTLTPEVATPLVGQELLNLILIGAGFFIVGVIIALLISNGKVLQLFKNNTTVLVVLLVLSLITPLTVNQVVNQRTSTTSQASTAVQIQSLNQIHIDPETVSLKFETSVPALVYLEYTNVGSLSHSIISPTDNVTQKATQHEFVINDVSPNGGGVTFIVNGSRLLLNNLPYKIN